MKSQPGRPTKWCPTAERLLGLKAERTDSRQGAAIHISFFTAACKFYEAIAGCRSLEPLSAVRQYGARFWARLKVVGLFGWGFLVIDPENCDIEIK